MLRNFGTVHPIFPKIAPKIVQDLKEKSHESSRRETSRGGGGGFRPPPPPPGPFRVNADTESIYS